jgi:NHLM bacteriocin system secretion protein
MADIYRKSALDKLSSPEQLDKSITIVSPSFWIAAVGGGIIIAVLLVWSILGKLPVHVSASGMYLGKEGINSVVAESEGIVQEVYVSDGDYVEAGQVIAKLDSELVEEELTKLQDRRAKVEAVTFFSTDDEATTDNKQLIDIKAQKIVSGASLDSSQGMLDARQDELATQRANTNSAKTTQDNKKAALDAAQTAYNNTQYAYSDATEEYNAASKTFSQYQEAAKKTSEPVAPSPVIPEPEPVEEPVPVEEPSEDDPEYETKYAEYQQYLSDKAIYDQYLIDLAAFNEYQTEYAEYQQAKAQFDQFMAEYNAAYNAVVAAGDKVNTAKNEARNAELNYKNAELEYSQAASAYNVEFQTQKSLESVVVQLDAQVASEQKNSGNQDEALRLQFDSAKESVLGQLDAEIDKYQTQLDMMTLKSRVSGNISTLNITTGSAVQRGQSICSISPVPDAETEGVICYIPFSEGKKIKEGMKVNVFPSTVNRQEYGHMEGTVISVSDYVVSSEEMMNQLGNSSLVQAFQQSGPVMKIVCDLKKDDSTVSGYYWSGKKGKDVMVEAGTLVTADIVTEEKAPISMLIPLLKDKLSGNSGNSQNGQNTGN